MFVGTQKNYMEFKFLMSCGLIYHYVCTSMWPTMLCLLFAYMFSFLKIRELLLEIRTALNGRSNVRSMENFIEAGCNVLPTCLATVPPPAITSQVSPISNSLGKTNRC